MSFNIIILKKSTFICKILPVDMKAFSISIEMMMVLCVSKMSHAEIIAYKGLSK